MGKLYFRYGCMGSSKTANALMVVHNYEERGKNPLLLKPRCEDRDGKDVLASRIGISHKCGFVEDLDWNGVFGPLGKQIVDAVIVDEVQFLEPQYIDRLGDIADEYDIPVICYGLRTDFRGKLFTASKRLMEIADVIEEIPTICWCGRKAQFNARVINGEVVTDGETFMLGANNLYVPLCRKHFKKGALK